MSSHTFDDTLNQLIFAMLNNPWDAHLVVDKEGILRAISPSNEDFYGKNASECLGKHVHELNPGSRLPEVIRTGKPEIGKIFKFRGKRRIVSRIPLRDEQGEIVGAVGKLMFWHTKQLKEMANQVDILEERLQYYRTQLKSVYGSRYSMENLIGESPRMQQAKRTAAQAAASADFPVLITGETGCGKEVFSHAIHQLSARRDQNLVKVNCASIPRELMESELFGYDAGAFTGAKRKGKPGKLEIADKGTLLLDEIGDMPLDMQAKLLRVLQEKEFERVGGTRTLRVDFRVIAVTNRDVKKMVGEGTFRQDLYYRLNVFHLNLPALRTIKEDIPRIAYYLLSRIKSEQHKAPYRISTSAMKLFLAYSWPGNVRELFNVLKRSTAVTKGKVLRRKHLPADLGLDSNGLLSQSGEVRALAEVVADAECKAVKGALKMANNNKSLAARILGIHRTGLYQKMKKYNITDV